MIELGQLERQIDEFAKRNTRIIAASMEGVDDSIKTQSEHPRFVVLADQQRGLINPAALVHEKMAQDGGDTTVPTTILVDRRGIVRWIFRPTAVVERIAPDDLLTAIDQNLRP